MENNQATPLPDAIVGVPQRIPKFNSEYGLWIFAYMRGSRTEAEDFSRLPFRKFRFYDISHLYDGDGAYCDESGTLLPVRQGEAIIVPPNRRHKYGGYKNFYCEDAISFCGPVADSLFRCGIIQAGVIQFGPIRRLLPIIELMLNRTKESQLQANIALQNLLMDLHYENQIRKGHSLVPNFIDQLITEIKAHPDRWWSVDSMAEACNLSPTHFTRVFKNRTGMTPKNYIDEVKMQMAVELLSIRSLTITVIATKLGFSDSYHFSRRFRQIKGYSPQNYREMFIR